MITKSPYKHTPGLGKVQMSEPLVPVRPRDKQDNIDRCLTCTVPARYCKGQCDGMTAQPGRGRPTKAPLERVAQMVRDGWTDSAICREFGITPGTLAHKKQECRDKGLLYKCRKR